MIGISVQTSKAWQRLTEILREVRASVVTTPEVRDLMSRVTSQHILRQVLTQADGRWAPLAESTQRARDERRGHYARSPITTSLTGVWTGGMLDAALGQGGGTVDEPTPTGIRRVFVYPPLLAFHRGTSRQPARPLIDDRQLGQEVQSFLRDLVRAKVNVAVRSR